MLQKIIRVFSEAFISYDRHTQINKNNKSKILSDYDQQDLSVVTQKPQILDMQRLQVNQRTQAY
jgi:hypothetical protein